MAVLRSGCGQQFSLRLLQRRTAVGAGMLEATSPQHALARRTGCRRGRIPAPSACCIRYERASFMQLQRDRDYTEANVRQSPLLVDCYAARPIMPGCGSDGADRYRRPRPNPELNEEIVRLPIVVTLPNKARLNRDFVLSIFKPHGLGPFPLARKIREACGSRSQPVTQHVFRSARLRGASTDASGLRCQRPRHRS